MTEKKLIKTKNLDLDEVPYVSRVVAHIQHHVGALVRNSAWHGEHGNGRDGGWRVHIGGGVEDTENMGGRDGGTEGRAHLLLALVN